ncbi:MAG: hypothetical protein DI539_09635 [Flavobacterium psychrophilum]|nr:MAG: hypothetical protein DI539_09635 [Flavobacterium psychrophilum]
MNKIFLVITLASVTAFGQKKLLEGISVKPSTIIIGRYPQYDKNQTYKEFNFILQNPEDVQKAINSLTYGKEYRNTVEDPDFRIEIIQDYNDVKSFTINPKQSSVRFDGHTYSFDLNQLRELAAKNPFKYRFEKVVFQSENEYQAYLKKQKENPDFLFDYAPQFKYEGSFEIEFKKSEKFSSPKAISEYARPFIEELVSADEYSFSYALNDKNIKNRDQYTMTVNGSKELFNKLKIDDLKNTNWEKTIEDGYFFYKTK